MAQLRREDRIRLFRIGDNSYEIRNKKDDVYYDADDDYFIYMRNVNFKNGYLIEGRYLGDITNDSPILDDQCKEVVSDGTKFYCEGKVVKTATMVAINNKTKVIIILENN